VKRGAAEARDLAAGLEAALEATLHDMEHRIDAVGRLHQPAAGASGTVPDAARLHTC
jgi:hypothetical protein